MLIAQTVCTFFLFDSSPWSVDWMLGLPLILLTVLINVLGLGLMGRRIVLFAHRVSQRTHPTLVFLMVVCGTTLLAASLHAIDAAIWAATYRLLGAMPNFHAAMLYSLNAITSYGHTNLALDDRWQLMGAMEALNGTLLFGLSTAFLFAVIQKVWLASREHW